jgi:hypothetical protein
MQSTIRSLTFLLYLSLAIGAQGIVFFYVAKFRHSELNYAELYGSATFVMLWCCGSLILKILKAFDARLTKIEKSNG